MPKRIVLPLLLLVSALALAACGGSESDEDKIVDVIETSATSTDPEDCAGLSTLKFMEQTQGESGAVAQDSCEESAEEDTGAESVEVTEVKVDGTKATADVSVAGGTLDGQEFTLGLIKQDGEWKLDEITEFTAFDKESLISAFETRLEEPDAELERPQIDCILETLRATPNDELEESILTGNSSMIFGTIISGCATAE